MSQMISNLSHAAACTLPDAAASPAYALWKATAKQYKPDDMDLEESHDTAVDSESDSIDPALHRCPHQLSVILISAWPIQLALPCRFLNPRIHDCSIGNALESLSLMHGPRGALKQPHDQGKVMHIFKHMVSLRQRSNGRRRACILTLSLQRPPQCRRVCVAVRVCWGAGEGHLGPGGLLRLPGDVAEQPGPDWAAVV